MEGKAIAEVLHKQYEEYGIGKVYDVIPATNMALVKFEECDPFKYGIDPAFGMWVHLSQLKKA